ncbi:MAG: hypothetical protein IPL19_18670 [Sandaracinaceae bacterium]|nr:hypothetical protein [Sandaracinaceae bacterium]
MRPSWPAPPCRSSPNAEADNLVPGCVRPNPDDPTNAALNNVAFPPRRLVEVAEGLDRLGAHGVVASICEARDPENGDLADFSPAVDDPAGHRDALPRAASTTSSSSGHPARCSARCWRRCRPA